MNWKDALARHITTFHDPFRPVSILYCIRIAREEWLHPQAKVRPLRVWIRRKGKSLTETFVNRDDAKNWGLEAERQIDRGGSPLSPHVSGSPSSKS